MKAILTVLGTDRTGIIARVSGKLFDNGVNILDITQTILSGYFTMAMLVDLSEMRCSFPEMVGALNELGSELGVQIRMQRSEIFDAMHRM